MSIILAHDSISVPLRFEFVRVPTLWKIATTKGDRKTAKAHPEVVSAMASVGLTWPYKGRIAIGKVDWNGSPKKLDGWECRKEFFRLPQTEEALLGFLNKVGLWEKNDNSGAMEVAYTMGGRLALTSPAPVEVDEVWEFRKDVNEA